MATDLRDYIGKLFTVMRRLWQNGHCFILSTNDRQGYAFMNGVLNTDNTSIYGLSLDFGPFAVCSLLI
jgi:Protein adenylyltransferase SelO